MTNANLLVLQAVNAVYWLIAVWKLGLVLQIMSRGPVKQAKRYSMTESITQKINLLITVYMLYVFYEAIMAAYQLPDASQKKLLIDLGIKLAFGCAALSLFGSMWGELQMNAGIGGADKSKGNHLLRSLNARGIYVVEFVVLMPALAIIKYIASGLWVPLFENIESAIR